ncbi:juvenile hormone epoxide hydrolase 2-like [Vespula pensylvanica]|uniref:juvenile hormone epoxide hydrolase 2-like n=1 Tax=Vespula pensylvanica TaxID=30213 RepID=UPI001CB9DE5E|nr:juvenile hormone epoxide hydrolase 2-like [Vespula pensylvanica]
MCKTTIVILLFSIGLYYFIFQRSKLVKPDLPETFWGQEKNKGASKEIRPFKIDVSKSIIDDLNTRLENPRLNVEPLEGVGWTYGISAPYLKKIIEYWRNEYNWTERQSLLNKYPQFYVQGGDWGAVITSSMAALYPEKIIGLHSNMCFHINPLNFWNILGVFFPSLVVDKQYEHKVYPLTNHFYRLIEETGYMHLQATKPDTIGLALTNSPVSLAGYILEKFSIGSNPDYRTRNDGGLLEKFTLNELLDNLMIYWVTDSFTTSARLYAEQFTQKYWDLKIHEIPINVPSACAVFPQEFFYFPEKVLRTRYLNLIQFNYMPKGGHFAAMEESIIFADDVFEFVGKIVELSNKRK